MPEPRPLYTFPPPAVLRRRRRPHPQSMHRSLSSCCCAFITRSASSHPTGIQAAFSSHSRSLSLIPIPITHSPHYVKHHFIISSNCAWRVETSTGPDCPDHPPPLPPFHPHLVRAAKPVCPNNVAIIALLCPQATRKWSTLPPWLARLGSTMHPIPSQNASSPCSERMSRPLRGG